MSSQIYGWITTVQKNRWKKQVIRDLLPRLQERGAVEEADGFFVHSWELSRMVVFGWALKLTILDLVEGK